MNNARAVFGVVVNSELLYTTLKSNPRKSVRFYDRMNRSDESAELVQFSMRRTRKAGDVSGLTSEQLKNKEPYIGPMR